MGPNSRNLSTPFPSSTWNHQIPPTSTMYEKWLLGAKIAGKEIGMKTELWHHNAHLVWTDRNKGKGACGCIIIVQSCRIVVLWCIVVSCCIILHRTMVLWCIIVCQFAFHHVVQPCSHLTCYVSVPVNQWLVWTWHRINNLPCKDISHNWLTASQELWLVLMSKIGSLVRDKKIVYNDELIQWLSTLLSSMSSGGFCQNPMECWNSREFPVEFGWNS